MAIESGQQLLHYRVTEKIGEGGMGVVWKALDTRLDREVAIKILPDAFAGDAERLARFEREAKLLASLNHPNIAAVYGLDEDAGVRFLVMELVEGEDLARRLERGPLAVAEALAVGLQVAEALEVAHDNGVIHRDLKPANIQLTPAGDVKVLDFGLAKAFDVTGQSADASMSPTVTSAGTLAGTILGTAAYMSPEQAHGRAADRRADIWSFGCVLYELLTGRMAFTGESISDTLASVLKFEPDHDALPADAPSAVRRLLRRCLTKDPKKRLQAIGEARIVVEDVLAGTADETEPSTPAAAPASRRRTALWLAALVAIAAVALVAGRQLQSEPEPPLRKLPIRAQGSLELNPETEPVVISPDGRNVAFVAEGRLWIRDLGRFDAAEIPGTEGASNPFWSPDGAWVGFGQRTKLLKVSVAGGSPVMIANLKQPIRGGGSDLAWWTDDRIVFCVASNKLFEVSAAGGDPRTLHESTAEGTMDLHDVSPLPDGRGLLYMIHRQQGRDTLAVLVDGTEKVVFQAEGLEIHEPVYSPTGHILYERRGDHGGIWAVPFSLAKLEATGEPFLVAGDAGEPSVSRDGTLAFVRRDDSATELAWYDTTGRVVGSFGEMMLTWPFPALSPDGGRVAVSAAADGNWWGNWDVWVHDLERGTKTRTTFAEDEQGAIAWTADGQRLIYSSGTGLDDKRLESLLADASSEPRVLWDGDDCRPANIWDSPHISPDGRFFAYTAYDKQLETADICVMELDVEGAEPRPFLNTPADELSPRFHPDGSYIAYQSGESGAEQIYITSFPEARGKWQVSAEGGAWPRWSADGRQLYFLRNRDLMVVDVDTKPGLRLGTPKRLFSVEFSGQDIAKGRPEGFSVAADGRFLFVRRVENDRDDRDSTGITLVENWFAEFDGG